MPMSDRAAVLRSPAMAGAARLIEVELRVRDVDRSCAFYRQLGVDVGDPDTDEPDGPRHSHATWGRWGSEDFLMLNIYPASDGLPSHASIGLSVSDLDALHARLVSDGVEVVRPPERRPWGRSAVYQDPDGNTVSLTERPASRA